MSPESKLSSLLEDQAHLECQAHFYHLVQDDAWFVSQVNEVEQKVRKLESYRTHLHQRRENAPGMLVELGALLALKKMEISEERQRLATEARLAHAPRAAIPSAKKPSQAEQTILEIAQKTGVPVEIIRASFLGK
jgi:hypothetical protein